MSLREVARAIRDPLRLAAAGFGVDARPGGLVLVTGGGEWAVKQIALALREQLTPAYPDLAIIDILAHRPYLSRANVHCLCRPAFFNGHGIPAVHPSNRLVVSWLHGGRNSVQPEIRAACLQLERHWRTVRRFIVPNSVTRKDVLECGVDPARVHMIPNGVDTAQFTPPGSDEVRRARREELGIAGDAFVVGSFQRDEDDAGQPKLVKGPDVLVEAVTQARQRVPVHVLLAGPSRNYVRKALEAGGIPYTYRRPEGAAELLHLYHALDAYLISSREEGGPTTLRESLASAVPLVSTRVGLAVDLLQHGVNGLVADVGDAEGLAAGLADLFLDPSMRTRLAVEGRRTIEALDFRVIAKRYQDEVYRFAFA